jgi:hypothetical protein
MAGKRRVRYIDARFTWLRRQAAIEAHQAFVNAKVMANGLVMRAQRAPSKAEEAARQGDEASALEKLESVGKWCLDVATKIGVSLATDAIKQSTGLN